MKIISVVGTRPQFIKAKPIIDELSKWRVKHILVHTGQHYDYDMSKVFFKELSIRRPDYSLGVCSFLHGKQTGLMLQRIEEVLLKESPDAVVVYGDTTSTLAGALASSKLNIPVIHIEAGLRSYRKSMPEEINRVVSDHVSSFLFCPTKTAVMNLKREGISKGIFFVGDVMYDLFINVQYLICKRRILPKIAMAGQDYFLLTIHRQENTDSPKNLKLILSALSESKVKIIFPVHPRTRKALEKIKTSVFKKNIFLLIPPIGYLDMLCLEKNAIKIITDSGGVQKEAYWFNIPCIILRKETEWVEMVNNGNNHLVGNNKEKIINALHIVSTRKSMQRASSQKSHVALKGFGAAARIVKILMKNFLK